jgi:hypothetical protein
MVTVVSALTKAPLIGDGMKSILVKPRSPFFWLLLAIPLLLCILLIGWLIWANANFSFERPPRVQEIALGDLNGDGFLDAYLAIAPDGESYLHPDYLLFNDGNGRFWDSGQNFGDSPSYSVDLGDLNGDGFTDLAVGVGWYGVREHLNDGEGLMTKTFLLNDFSEGEGIYSFDVAVADLNNDGFLDIFGAGCCGGATSGTDDPQVFSPTSLVWLNVENRHFSSTGQRIGQAGSLGVALADLNGDGDVDVFLANHYTINVDGNTSSGTENAVWFNDGQGNFSDSGQKLGKANSYAVALGDLNGDGFPDAVVGNRGPDEIWFNDGQGYFTKSNQRLGNEWTRSVFLSDLNGDGRLDLVIGGETNAQVWFNDGRGNFSAEQSISYDSYDAIALGDVTGDGIPDIFVAGVESYQVWRGNGDGTFSAGELSSHR